MPDQPTPNPVSATELPPAAGTGTTRPALSDVMDRVKAEYGDALAALGDQPVSTLPCGHTLDGIENDEVSADEHDRCAPEVFELDVPMLLHPKAHGPRSQPGEPLNANWRMHWKSYNERVGVIRHGVVTAALAAKVPHARHLTVQLHYRPGDQRRRDADNLWPVLKAACDALARGPRRDWVGLELVPDDTPEHMTKLTPVIHPRAGERRLWITVEVQR
ncbi:RusA family crossover junction endodeoxyribonuclease [Actinophytocola sediminis]